MISEQADRELCSRHPGLFKLGKYDTFGFGCAEGWLGILDGLCECITNADRQSDSAKTRIVQVKEKLGSLRVYHSSHDPIINAYVRMAEEMSQRVCEVCGSPGKLITDSGWMRTRCPDHQSPPESLF